MSSSAVVTPLVPARPAASPSVGAAEVLLGLNADHRPSMLAYATQLTNDLAAAEDLVQEALLRAWQHPQVATNGKGSVRGWLLTVVRNLAIDSHRHRQRRPTEVVETPHTPARVHADHGDAVVARLVVQEALTRISPEHRAVLTNLYLAGRSVAETSRVMGVPVGTVKSRSHYALISMKSVIADDRDRAA